MAPKTPSPKKNKISNETPKEKKTSSVLQEISLNPISKLRKSKPTKKIVKKVKNPLSITDIISNGGFKLKKVGGTRSPGGSIVKKTKKEKVCFQSDLFNAIKKKFKNVNKKSPKKNKNFDDSFSSDYSTDTSVILSPSPIKGKNENSCNNEELENLLLNDLDELENELKGI
jgi:hypothetical protein